METSLCNYHYASANKRVAFSPHRDDRVGALLRLQGIKDKSEVERYFAANKPEQSAVDSVRERYLAAMRERCARYRAARRAEQQRLKNKPNRP